MIIRGRATLAMAALVLTAMVALSCEQATDGATGGATEGASAGPALAAAVDSLMLDLHERGLFDGAVVLGSGDEILYERGFGMANVAENVPFTPGTPSYGASMHKTFTAAAVFMLQEEGLLDVDDPVTKYIPEFPYPDVRIRHLLAHSSGLHVQGPYFFYLDPTGSNFTKDRLLELMVEHTPPLAFTPGSGFLYSAGILIADIVIERVTNSSFASFLEERIFEPLGMDSSFVPPVSGDDFPGVQTLEYRRDSVGTLQPLGPDPSRSSPYYSARDLFRWVSSFYADPVMGDSALQAGLEPPVLGGEHASAINLLNWYYPDSGRRFYFTGDNQGYFAFAYWDADSRQSAVYVTNLASPSWVKPALAIALIDILAGREPAPIVAPEYTNLVPSIAAAVPSLDDLSGILGVYEMESSERVTIENPPPGWGNIEWGLPDGWFAPVARVDGGLRYNIFPIDNGMFYIPGLDAFIGFTEGADGLTIHWTTVFEGTSTGTRVSGS